MRERGDLTCFHEPFMYDYYAHRKVRTMPYFTVMPGHPVNYDDISSMLLNECRTAPVFFKDMSYYVVPQILHDTRLLSRLTHCFLIRDPKAAILSYYKLDADVTLEEIGLEAQAMMIDKLHEKGEKTLVIQAEDMRTNPSATLNKLWQFTGLTPMTDSHQWHDKPVDDWQQVSGWHKSVIESKGIETITTSQLTKEREKSHSAFDSACVDAPQLQQFFDHHQPFYQKLRKLAEDTA